MSDFRKMTVQSLRELARKVLGPGHSRFRTKGELVTALEEAEKKVASAVEKAGTRLKKATSAASDATARAVRAARGAAKGQVPSKLKRGVAGKARAAAVAAGAAAVGALAARRKARRAAEVEADTAAETPERTAKPKRAASRRGRAGADVEPERDEVQDEERAAVVPDPEGYFVARVRGEDAIRGAPHPLSEGAAGFRGAEGTNGHHRYDENLGELPWSYGDDSFVALPRDPRTLFFYWDFSDETRTRAFAGLDHPRVQLWIFARQGEGWERVRTLDFTLEARGWYVHELDPGRVYRAEVHAVDRAGQVRRLGQESNEVKLPPFGPSPVVEDRFLRLPWSLPLGRLLGPGHAGTPFSEEARALLARLSDWARFGEAPGGGRESAGGAAAGRGEGAGGLGGRTQSGAPTSPSSPFGPFGAGGGR